MELQYLKYFVAVAEKLSFRKAAEVCHVSQPSLSAQIKLFEDELGYLLFNRTKRSVILTKEGEHLLPYAKRILDEVKLFPNRVNEYAELVSGLIVCGTSPLIAHSNVLKKLSKLKRDFPGLNFHLQEASTDDLIAGLKSHKFDVILLPYNSEMEDIEIRYEVLDDDSLKYIFPKGLGKRAKKELPFISVPPGCGLRQFMDQSSRSLKFNTHSLLMAHHADMIARWVELGLGWSLLPERSIRSLEGIVIQRPEKSLKIEYCICVLKDRRGESVLDHLSSFN